MVVVGDKLVKQSFHETAAMLQAPTLCCYSGKARGVFLFACHRDYWPKRLEVKVKKIRLKTQETEILG